MSAIKVGKGYRCSVHQLRNQSGLVFPSKRKSYFHQRLPSSCLLMTILFPFKLLHSHGSLTVHEGVPQGWGSIYLSDTHELLLVNQFRGRDQPSAEQTPISWL